jgi:carboxypeptidase D
MIYDGCIGAYDSVQQQLPTVPFVKANNEHFKFEDEIIEDMETMHESCGHKAHLQKYLTFPAAGVQPKVRITPSCNVFNRVQFEVRNTNQCFNV